MSLVPVEIYLVKEAALSALSYTKNLSNTEVIPISERAERLLKMAKIAHKGEILLDTEDALFVAEWGPY